MKTVLILAYDFPPYVSVGGLRPYAWYKYLSGCGVHPTLVTRQWQNRHKNHLDYISPGESDEVIVETDERGTILRTPYRPNLANRLYLKYGERRFRILRKLVSGFYEFSQYVLPIGPKAEIYKAADEFLKNNRVDAIVASGDPFVLFRYASVLGKKYGIPWVADYRDPWSEGMGIKKNGLLRKWSTFLEKRTLQNVSHVVTVSEFVKNQVVSTRTDIPFTIIPNGYDPESAANIDLDAPGLPDFSIALAGSIFEWHPIRSFLAGYDAFIRATPQARASLNFYGINISEELREMVDTDFPALKTRVHIFPKMPNDRLMPLLAQNHAFLLFNYYSFMGTKIYDYLALRRPILLCYSADGQAEALKERFFHVDESQNRSVRLQEDLINQTGSGHVVPNEAHLTGLLGKLYAEFLQNGRLYCNASGAETFSRKTQTRMLADMIKSL